MLSWWWSGKASWYQIKTTSGQAGKRLSPHRRGNPSELTGERQGWWRTMKYLNHRNQRGGNPSEYGSARKNQRSWVYAVAYLWHLVQMYFAELEHRRKTHSKYPQYQTKIDRHPALRSGLVPPSNGAQIQTCTRSLHSPPTE